MSVRVTYFNAEVYGEPIRLCLKLAGVDFEDRRVKGEEWLAIKPTLPNGEVPTLEMDGKFYVQITAIVRFLGRKYKMLPEDPDQQYDCDYIMESCFDIYKMLLQIVQMQRYAERFGYEGVDPKV